MARTRVSDATVKKKRGRPPGSRKSDVAKPAAKPAQAKGTKKSGKRKAVVEEEEEDELSFTNPKPSSRPHKRQTRTEPDEVEKSRPRAEKQYAQLESRKKRIPQEHIETWPQISSQVLEQIVAVLRDAKKDIANTQRDERKVVAAYNSLNPLVRKLERQLQASRIPPSAKDVHFNIDMLTERNIHISREVTTARHSKQLLSEQVKVAQNLLEKDEDALDELKRNVKKWKSEWKRQEKNGRMHPLLKDSDNDETPDDLPEDIGLKQSEHVEPALLDTADEELAPILEQLRRSLKHIQGNHMQLEGVDETMRNAQIALDDVLFRHTSAQQYAAI